MTKLIEYIVIVKKIEDKQALHDEIINSGGSEYIPDRAIESHLNPITSRCTHYMMTEAEAELLKQDPRVLDITRTAEDLGIIRQPAGSYTQTTNLWSRGDITAQGDINWGILRTVEGVQRFEWGTYSPQQLFDVTASVTVPHDGTNVDVVIVDGHADPAHPEYAVNSDGTGGSRYNQFNWLSLSNGLFGTTNGTYIYTPYTRPQGATSSLESTNMHGSHVAGTACGNTQGWARKANIYNISPYGNDSNSGGFGSSTNQFIDGYFFEYIKYWHQNKAVNPATGTRNPTIMNNSWVSTVLVNIADIQAVTYQYTTYTAPAGGFSMDTLNGYGFPTYNGSQVRVLQRDAALEAQLQDCIDAGIIVVGAAGNFSTKIARDDQSSSDLDYNNSFFANGNAYYYNRGTFSTISNGIVVGSLGAEYFDIKAYYSETGPRIDVWSPGSYIMSSVLTNNTPNYSGAVADARNGNYYQVKISGTSMASPQVTGLLACLLEVFPSATQADAMAYIKNNMKTGTLQDGGYGGIYDVGLLQGAPDRILYADFPPSPTATVTLPTVIIRNKSQTKFTPVVGSGGVGVLNYSVFPALPTGYSTIGWVQSIPGNVTQAYFQTNSNTQLQAGDYISGPGLKEGTFLLSPTDAGKQTWVISPGYEANVGSGLYPITINTGLHINSATGEITGRTNSTQGSTAYTVTISNNGGTVSGTFSLAITGAAVYTRVNDIPYGSDALQKVDIYFQNNSTAKGVILYAHGGGWTGGAKSSAGYQTSQAGYWLNDEDQIGQLANQGYIVINCNYRLAVATGSSEATNWVPSGGSTGHYHPDNANDIETIIRFATTPGAGAGSSAYWANVVSAVNTYGLLLSGESAGGHLVAFAGMKYIYDYSSCPFVGIAPMVGPMDLDWITLNDNKITQSAKDIVNNLINNSGGYQALQSASPRYVYGTNASPGYVHTAVKNSSVRWYFMNNVNDTLVVPSLTDNFINTLEAELGNNRVKYVKLDEGAYSTLTAHNVTSPLSTRITTLATLAFALTATVAVASKFTTSGTAITPFTPVTFAGGGGTKTYSISPSLPANLSFNTSTGTVSGTPAAASQTQTYTVTATDASGRTASGTFTLSVQSSGGGGGGGGSGTQISHTEWNLIQSKLASILGSPSDSVTDVGWNQPSSIVSQQVATDGQVSGTEYNQLTTDINTCYSHINNTQVNNGTRNDKQLITYADYSLLSGQVDYVYTNRGSASSTKLTASSWTAHGGNISFSQAHGFHYQVDFASNAAFRSFWNAGGYITWDFSFVPSIENLISVGWKDLCASMGSFRLTRNSFSQIGQAITYPATIGQTGGVYGGNMLINPDPLSQVITPTAKVFEADANYTNSYFVMWIGIDNADLFQAKSVIVNVALQNMYVGAGGSNIISSGNPGLSQTTTYPFSIQQVGQTNVYNYIDGTRYNAPGYPGIQPSF